MPFAAVDDVDLFFTDEGAGDPPMLFVHGYSCDSHDWSWQLAYFAERHRVIALDLRGHGRSSVPDGDYRPAQFAADIAALLRRLNPGPVVAVGHSLGGAIVSTLAVEYPDLVRAVVSVDPAYLLPDEFRPIVVAMAEALRSEDPIAGAQAFLSATYSSASPPALKTWHMRRIAGMPAHVLQQTLGSLFEPQEHISFREAAAPYLRRRQAPVFAIYTDPERAAFEATLFADARSKSVSWEGAGHWLHQERPVEFNHLLTAWLASL